MRADLFCEVVVHDVLEVDLVKVVGPGVKHGKAFMFNALGAVLLNVLFNERKFSLVGAYRVG